MSASQPGNFNLQEFTDAGLLLLGGRLYTYAYGTTAQKVAYTDPDGTIPHTYTADGIGGQYITLNARGELPAPLYLAPGAYDIALKRADGSSVWTRRVDPTGDGVATLATSIGASLVGFLQAIAGAVLRTVGDKLFDTMSVKDFGAKGDGVTDDTAALNVAAAKLPSNKSLYFPAGTYIVDTGCVLFRNKSNITVYGDGAATIVRPSVQGVAPAKQDYPTTILFDLCSGLTVRDMVIESKGESYGNIDAYAPASGQPRADAIASYGGSALAVCRSDHVKLSNLDARRCGSCGVVYLSSCEDVVVSSCFANARSLGYAGFAIDNWVDSALKTKRNYKFFNPRVAKEDAACSAKAGIASEGDQVAGRLINLEVIGGSFEDCATGGDVLYLGTGISAFETRLTVNGLNVKNCYIGVTWQKRGGATDKSWCRISGGAFDACAVAGVYIAIGTAAGGSDVTILGTRIDVAAASAWAGNANKAVAYSSGVTVAGYTNGEINVQGVGVSGGQYGLWAIDNAVYNVTGGSISGSIAAVWTYGGGTLRANGARMFVTAGDRVIGRNTNTLDNTASYNLSTYVSNNTLTCVNAADYAISLNGNSALFAETQVTRNAVTRGVVNASKGSATLYDVDVPVSWTPVVKGDGTAGTYELNAGVTVCTVTKMGSLITANAYIVLAAAITGGGTGNLVISGLPIPKRAGSAAFGNGVFSGVDLATGAQISCYFGTTNTASDLLFWQTTDNASVTLLPVAGVSASDVIAFSVTYEA